MYVLDILLGYFILSFLKKFPTIFTDNGDKKFVLPQNLFA